MKCQPPNSQTSAACAAVAVPNKPHCPRPPHFIPLLLAFSQHSKLASSRLKPQGATGHCVKCMPPVVGPPQPRGSCTGSTCARAIMPHQSGARCEVHARGGRALCPSRPQGRAAVFSLQGSHNLPCTRNKRPRGRTVDRPWGAPVQYRARAGGSRCKRCALVQGGRQGPAGAGHSAATTVTDLS